MSRENDYTAPVYTGDTATESEAPPIVRALHAELCRNGVHSGQAVPACERAWAVVRRWHGDGSPATPEEASAR